MTVTVDVIKGIGKKRHIESFDYDKLYGSVISACLSVHTPIGQSEITAKAVCDKVVNWTKNHHEITSHDIRTITSQYLADYHSDAAYLYEQKRITI